MSEAVGEQVSAESALRTGGEGTRKVTPPLILRHPLYRPCPLSPPQLIIHDPHSSSFLPSSSPHLVRHSRLRQPRGQPLALLHGGGAHEHRPPRLVHAGHLHHRRAPLAICRAEDDVRLVLTGGSGEMGGLRLRV